MSDDLVKRARGVLSGVTPGPWRLRPDDEEDEPAQCIRARGFDIATCWGGYIAGDSDARFIAAARELVPAMAARIEELEAKLKTYDEIGWALEEDAGQLRAKLAKAVGLVQQAFNEGFGSGMDDVLKSSGGRTWYDSRSRKRLAEINGGGDT